MQVRYSFLLLLLFAIAQFNPIFANKNIAFQTGTIHLKNGDAAHGLTALKIVHGEDEIVFKHNENSAPLNFPISVINTVIIGDEKYFVSNIQSKNNEINTALLSSVDNNHDKLFNAYFYDEKSLGKNNSVLLRTHAYVIKHQNELVELTGKDYKNQLQKLWMFQPQKINHLENFSKVGIEELKQIITSEQ